MIAAARVHGRSTVRAAGPPRTLAAVASPRLAARLAAGGPARIVHAGAHAVYLDLDGWCLGVVSTRAVAVPCALRTALPDLGALAAATSARVDDAGLLVGDARVEVARLEQATVPPLPHVDPSLSALVLDAGAPAARELDGLLPAPLPTLLGLGSGLTPLADDVLCGWLAAHYALGAPSPELADPRPRTTLLSATLVDCARHGEAIPELRALVRALASRDPSAVHRAVTAVAAVGHTSGAGLLLGAGLRLREEAPR